MSRHTRVVKSKHEATLTSTPTQIKTLGPIDLHFHGAFGIDLMTATPKDLDTLSQALWKKGVAGFCATTLSSPKKELATSVERLGRWIRMNRFPGAKPLGIHLEGPFINPLACGAHPPHTVRKLNWDELDHLWLISQKTLKILTVAPEILSPHQLRQLSRWSQSREIILSLGHSQASEQQASSAFKQGFQGVTHAWNALSFHQRQPGALGAALGNPKTYLELIIDEVHVSPSVIHWTLQLHPSQSICFISDCLVAGGYSSRNPKWHSFGSHQIHFKEGACRLKNGQLAGGGFVITDVYRRWVKAEALRRHESILKTFKNTVHHLTQVPFRILGLPPGHLADRQVTWSFQGTDQDSNGNTGRFDVIPVDSIATSR